MEMKNDGAGRTLETEEEGSRRRPEEEESVIDDEEREIEELEREVNEMAAKILEYRTNLPSQLSSTFSSILTSSLSDSVSSGSDPGPSALSSSSGEVIISSEAGLLMEEDQKTIQKIGLLKAKMSRNIAAMPVVLKRMRECISNIDKLDLCNGIIHRVFKQKRTS